MLVGDVYICILTVSCPFSWFYYIRHLNAWLLLGQIVVRILGSLFSVLGFLCF